MAPNGKFGHAVSVSNIQRPTYQKVTKRSLALSLVAYFGAIAVVGWFVVTQGQMISIPDRKASSQIEEKGGLFEIRREADAEKVAVPRPQPTVLGGFSSEGEEILPGDPDWRGDDAWGSQDGWGGEGAMEFEEPPRIIIGQHGS